MLSIADVLAIGTAGEFEACALELFRFQALACAPYREYLDLIGVRPNAVQCTEDIPFLPIELFKSHEVYCGPQPPEAVFTSSATTGMKPSRHSMANLDVYEQTFIRAFELFYGPVRQTAIFALLPNYLQRKGSSLVYMADRLIRLGGGGFYLDDYDRLLADLAAHRGQKILLGVSYALWDLAERYAPRLENTIVMETGGMKGRREELPKAAFHRLLCDAFGVESIHSEYGMAELTSQAYSRADNLFYCPPWMRLRVRDVNDPFDVRNSGRGGVNIIDLANLTSCAFIQTQDLGTVYGDGAFSILGRIDHSELRGCNFLVQ